MKIKLLAAGLFFLGGVISTHAQASGVRVRVPFEFEIANQTLPAGEYVVWSEGDQVWLRVYRGNTVAVVQSNRTVHDGGKSGKVVFSCYEKLCFLSQLWLPDANVSREILTSKSEKQATKHGEPQQLALLGESPR
jgi:hypothetical protein